MLTYSLESTIAEKWDAIIDRMEFNSRMKDFYGIYYLANNFDFEGKKLQEAIFETINNRGRRYEKDTLEKVELLKEDIELLSRWKMFIENTLEINLSFEQVIVNVVNFIGGPFESIVYEEEFFLACDQSE